MGGLYSASGRIETPVMWGSRGWASWGIRHWEAGILRGIMMCRSQTQGVPLYIYSEQTRCWYVNLQYKDLRMASWYLETFKISGDEWREFK